MGPERTGWQKGFSFLVCIIGNVAGERGKADNLEYVAGAICSLIHICVSSQFEFIAQFQSTKYICGRL